MLLISLALNLGSRSAAQGPPALTPSELVKRAVENEVRNNNQGPKYMCRQRKETPAGSQTKLMVETRDAMVGMVVAYNDQPLNQQQPRSIRLHDVAYVNQPHSRAAVDRRMDVAVLKIKLGGFQRGFVSLHLRLVNSYRVFPRFQIQLRNRARIGDAGVHL